MDEDTPALMLEKADQYGVPFAQWLADFGCDDLALRQRAIIAEFRSKARAMQRRMDGEPPGAVFERLREAEANGH